MPKIVLQVTHGPRWDHKTGRHQQNGEVVTLEAATDAELLLLIADHEVHCRTVLEGVMPSGAPTASKPSGAREKAPEGPSEASGTWSQTYEPIGASKAPEAAPKEAPKKPNQCPRCGQAFRSPKGLQIHFGHTGHDAPEPSTDE